MTLRLVIRADASQSLGAGHVMRCLTLAGEVRARGGDAAFVAAPLPGHMADAVRERGFESHLLEAGLDAPADAAATAALARAFGADRVVVDHYGLDAAWERAQPCPVMAIDDLTDRPHACDILLNQNLGARAGDYAGLVPPGTACLMGVEHALLRPDFAAARADALAGRQGRDLGRLMISLGGTDPANGTGWALEVLAGMDLPAGLAIDVIMGSRAPHLDAVRARAAALPGARVLVDTPDMAALMAAADLAIGAAGSSSWERCCLGLPALMVVLADNQAPIAAALDAAGAARRIALGEDAALATALGALIADPSRLGAMQRAAAALCDGQGAVRVVDRMADMDRAGAA